MPDIKEYLAGFPSKNDPSFRPHCCPMLERMYAKLFSAGNISFIAETGLFILGNTIYANFRVLSLTGGQDWIPQPETSGSQLVLIKNPQDQDYLIPPVGERNGITLIDGTLFALSPFRTGVFDIRRPVRPTHIPEKLIDLKTQFLRFSQLYLDAQAR